MKNSLPMKLFINVLVKPHQKTFIRSHHTFSNSSTYPYVRGMTKMIESQSERQKAMIEFERKRDQNFFEF